MKVLLTGSTGQLGKTLIVSKPKNIELIKVSSKEFNLLDYKSCKEFIFLHRPDWVINAAAYTEVDKAQSEPEKVFEINTKTPEKIARTLSTYGGKMLYISTDFVFDGKNDKPYKFDHIHNPINIYGKSKSLGEEQCLLIGNCYVLRTSWVYSPFNKNFLLKILNLQKKFAKDNLPLKVISDQIGSPTNTFGLAQICWLLLNKISFGTVNQKIFHWSDKGQISWFEFANKISLIGKELGLLEKKVDILKINASDFKADALRPYYSVLNCEVTENLLNIKQKNWDLELRKVMVELKNDILQN